MPPDKPLSKLPKADRDLVERAVSAVTAGSAKTLEALLPALIERDLLDYGKAVSMHHALLHLAIDKGHHALVERLLDAGADIEVRAYGKKTPLMSAVKDSALVELLLARGAAVDARDAGGATALHAAAVDARSSVDVLRALLAAGAAVDARENAGRTPLHQAGASGSAEKVRALLGAGADANAMAQGEQGTPIRYLATCRSGIDARKREAVLELLLEAGGQDAAAP